MELQAVDSSLVGRVGYDKKTKVLRIQFRDMATWDYAGVPLEVYTNLLAARSVGAYFLAQVKANYQGQRISSATGKQASQQPVIVATPVYLALLKCKKLMGANYLQFPYMMWCACGKPAKDKESTARDLYKAALRLVAEAGNNMVGGEFVDAAIELAKGRRL